MFECCTKVKAFHECSFGCSDLTESLVPNIFAIRRSRFRPSQTRLSPAVRTDIFYKVKVQNLLHSQILHVVAEMPDSQTAFHPLFTTDRADFQDAPERIGASTSRE